MSKEIKTLSLDFRSKYDYVKSLQPHFGLSDEEANSFLWILDMWDKKRLLDPPSDFVLTQKAP